MTGGALRALVAARLHAERRAIAFTCAAAATVGFVQPHGVMTITDPLGADIATRSVWLAGPMFFCSVIAIAIALVQGPGRHPYLDASESSAPLFGRELARAKALAHQLVVREKLAPVHALDALQHDDRRTVFVEFDVVDGHHVRMFAQCGSMAGLAMW